MSQSCARVQTENEDCRREKNHQPPPQTGTQGIDPRLKFGKEPRREPPEQPQREPRREPRQAFRGELCAKPSFTFPKSFRIHSRRQYQQISRQHVRHVGRWIIVDARKTSHTSIRLGITVTRHYGGATERNRFKRIVREAFRLCCMELQPGFDLNIKPRSAALDAKPADLIVELKQFLARGLCPLDPHQRAKGPLDSLT